MSVWRMEVGVDPSRHMKREKVTLWVDVILGDPGADKGGERKV